MRGYTPVALLVSVDSGATWLPLATLTLNGPCFTELAAEPASRRPYRPAWPKCESTYHVDGDVLIGLLESQEVSTARQAAAARVLGLLGDTSAVPALLSAAQSSDVRVAIAAIESLGMLRAEAAVPLLASLMAEPRTATLSQVADVLAAIGTPEALMPLHDALASDGMTPARHAAMGVLERLGSAAVPGLLAQTGSDSAVVQRNAIEMLGWIADPAADRRAGSGLAGVRSCRALTGGLGAGRDPGRCN